MAIEKIGSFSVNQRNAAKFNTFITDENGKKSKKTPKTETTPTPPNQNLETKIDANAAPKETWGQWLKRQANNFIKSGLTCTGEPGKVCNPKADAGGW